MRLSGEAGVASPSRSRSPAALTAYTAPSLHTLDSTVHGHSYLHSYHMATSRPRPQDPVNGGWSDAPLSRPHSPPPYSSPPPERDHVDFALGSMDHVSIEEDSEDEPITSEVAAAFDKLHEQLRRHRAPVVQPPVPQHPFPFMRLPLELREQVYDEYFKPEVGSAHFVQEREANV